MSRATKQPRREDHNLISSSFLAFATMMKVDYNVSENLAVKMLKIAYEVQDGQETTDVGEKK